MFPYQIEPLKTLLSELIRSSLTAETGEWLTGRSTPTNLTDAKSFNQTFAILPRKTGKSIIQVTNIQANEIQRLRPGFSINGWTTDRLCRVWLLLQIDPSDKEIYSGRINQLFRNAEMNEQVALYSALPLLAYPENWSKLCAEGIRSNIGDVLEAILCDNPYPSEQLNEPAWNQLVLKAFFTEKPIDRIIGLDQRTNRELAGILSDYAHERWAAHRLVHPQLWRCVGKFIDERIFPDIKKIALSENPVEREAAALACADSDYAPAKELLESNKELKTRIVNGYLSWRSIAGTLPGIK
ncbi:EboA domain-containing protein [Flavitalea flava]